MDDFDLPGIGESSTALCVISALPFDGTNPLLAHYPAMKLGVRESVRFCGHHLTVAAEGILEREPAPAGWVIAGPPRFAIPAAANLLAVEVQRGLAERSGGLGLPLADLRYAIPEPDALRIVTPTAWYSRASFDDRLRSRRQLHEGRAAPPMDPLLFRDRAVLFVNDINVTGTQQHFMRQALRAAGVASVHWLYVVQVEPNLGRAHPEIEYGLNRARLARFDEFAEVVAHAEIDHTARCVDLLLGHSDAELEPLFRSMSPERGARLVAMAMEEAIHKGTGEADGERLSRVRGWLAAAEHPSGS